MALDSHRSSRPGDARQSSPRSSRRRLLDYATPEKDPFQADVLVDPVRDVQVPVALFALGFAALFVRVATDSDSQFVSLPALVVAMCLITGAKTAILVALALAVAPRYGISFGTLRTAILKFAAILVCTDGIVLWICEMLGLGMSLTRPHIASIPAVLIAAGAIILLSRYLFEMEYKETTVFAVPVAVLSQILGAVLAWIAVAAL